MNLLLDPIQWDDLDVDVVKSNSFKDFHAKGLDYVCLHRSPELTLKAYFFSDADSQRLSEVVNPHDHRYPFLTQCYSGVIENRWYREPVEDAPREYFNAFHYFTPLNGGAGFTEFLENVSLERHRTKAYRAGGCYSMKAEEFHTIRVAASQTVIVLAQHEDVIPANQPTTTFVRGHPPSLKGLYSEFSSDEIVERLRLLRKLHVNLK